MSERESSKIIVKGEVFKCRRCGHKQFYDFNSHVNCSKCNKKYTIRDLMEDPKISQLNRVIEVMAKEIHKREVERFECHTCDSNHVFYDHKDECINRIIKEFKEKVNG